MFFFSDSVKQIWVQSTLGNATGIRLHLDNNSSIFLNIIGQIVQSAVGWWFSFLSLLSLLWWFGSPQQTVEQHWKTEQTAGSLKTHIFKPLLSFQCLKILAVVMMCWCEMWTDLLKRCHWVICSVNCKQVETHSYSVTPTRLSKR